jgi:hypothetical protein
MSRAADAAGMSDGRPPRAAAWRGRPRRATAEGRQPDSQEPVTRQSGGDAPGRHPAPAQEVFGTAVTSSIPRGPGQQAGSHLPPSARTKPNLQRSPFMGWMAVRHSCRYASGGPSLFHNAEKGYLLRKAGQGGGESREQRYMRPRPRGPDLRPDRRSAQIVTPVFTHAYRLR